MEINGVNLTELLPSDTADFGRLPGKLCWQVFTEGTTASIEVRATGFRHYRVHYLPFDGPSGVIATDTPREAYDMTVTLGGVFAHETGPRGD